MKILRRNEEIIVIDEKGGRLGSSKQHGSCLFVLSVTLFWWKKRIGIYEFVDTNKLIRTSKAEGTFLARNCGESCTFALAWSFGNISFGVFSSKIIF